MTIAEVTGYDPRKAELERIKKETDALKVRKARIKADQAQRALKHALTSK